MYNIEKLRMPMNKRILLVDDETNLRSTLPIYLEAVGYPCIEAQDGYDAHVWLENDSPDIGVTDHQMPRVTGWEPV